MLVSKKSIENKVLSLLIFFPFIVPLISGTDTQPTIILFFLIYLFRILDKNIVFFISVYIVFCLFYSIFFWDLPSQLLAKSISYFQFILSMLLGYYIHKNNIRLNINQIIYTYLIFTIIHIITGGFIENILITSRDTSIFYLNNL